MLFVARGRFNEGINLADHIARACFVVGIPYLPLGDSKVILRKNYAESKSDHSKAYLRDSKDSAGDLWYKTDAMREVSQIMGRCVRHKDDYAAIFLVDARYLAKPHKCNLPSWFTHRLKPFFNAEHL